MTEIHRTDILVDTASSGLEKFWQGIVLASEINDSSSPHYTQSRTWRTTKDGGSSKEMLSEPTLIVPTNVGRSNERGPRDQAMFEIDAAFKDKVKKGYHLPGVASHTLPLPMRCQVYGEARHRFEFGQQRIFVQPKANGNRILADGDKFWSREGLLFHPETIAHIRRVPLVLPEQKASKAPKPKLDRTGLVDLLAVLDPIFEPTTEPVDLPPITSVDFGGCILDGELILPHGYEHLEDTNKAILKYNPVTTPMLMFRVFDLYDENLGFARRIEKAREIVARLNHPQIVIMETVEVFSEEQLMAWHQHFTDKDAEVHWEGTIVRLDGKGYEGKLKKSVQSLKLKDFVDGEFEVVGIEAGTGKHAECATLVMLTNPRPDEGFPDRLQFKVSSFEGSEIRRREIYANPDEEIGRWWTIRFQGYTKKGVPFFATAVDRREPAISGRGNIPDEVAEALMALD